MAGGNSDILRRARHFGRHGDLERIAPGTYPRMFVAGDGLYLTDSVGHRVLDAGNHLGVNVVGHARRDMAEAIAAQVLRLEYCSLDAGTTHDVLARLTDRLAEIVPVQDPMFAFTSSGSEANEIAFKLARDYQRRRGEPSRHKILSRAGSYHGSTMGAVSATAIDAFQEPFAPLVPGFVRLPVPFPGYCGTCEPVTGSRCTCDVIARTAEVIEREGPETIAAIVAEPISISGAVKVPPDDYWPFLRELCDKFGILLIADEVVNGFGRTGTMFGVDHWGIRPDMMTFAKGLTSGYVPMGGVAMSRKVADEFASEPFVSINTYAGHPVACAAALKTLDIIDDEALVKNAAGKEGVLAAAFAAIAAESRVPARSSVIGLMASIEFRLPPTFDVADTRAQLWHACYQAGIALRVTADGNVVTLFYYPSLTIDDRALRSSIDEVRRSVAGVLGTRP